LLMPARAADAGVVERARFKHQQLNRGSNGLKGEKNA
jgi:hypothetical protein